MINSRNLKITKIDADLWAIEDIKSSEKTISYLICGKNKAVAFDTGLGLSPAMPLIRKVTRLPVVVILSHWHFDHTGGAYEFEELIGWQSSYMETASKYGIGTEKIKSQVGHEFLNTIKSNDFSVKPFPKINLTNREKILDIGGYKLKILHTPGHTIDSVCLYELRKGWLFAGDTAYAGPIYLQFEDSSQKDYKKSIEKLLKLEIKKVFPGHNKTLVSKDILFEIHKLLLNSTYKSSIFSELKILYGGD